MTTETFEELIRRTYYLVKNKLLPIFRTFRETKIDCETKNHLSLSEALVINLQL
jgi:hypothetical protein